MWKIRRNLVIIMILAAAAVGSLVYFFTDNWRIALGVASIVLIIDLTYVPKLLPNIFKDDNNQTKS